MSDYVKQHATASTFTKGESWTVLTEIEQSIKRKIEAAGVPLKDWDVKINRGILTGCNEAFVIDGATKDRLIKEDPKSAEIIRPILRGRDIKRYGYDFKDTWLITTHNGYKNEGGTVPPVDIDDYPAIKRHLDGFWDQISKRGDRGVTPYNLRNCAYMDDFSKQKIIWAELARTGNAFVFDDSQSVLLNTGYILIFDTETQANETFVKACVCYLNSRAVLFYLDHITSRFDENGYRWLKQFVELIPLPEFSNEASIRLSCIYDQIAEAKKHNDDARTQLLEAQVEEIIETELNLDACEIAYLSSTY